MGKLTLNESAYIEKSSAEPRKKQYRKICFKETIYEVGDTLLFRETESTNVVGKLIRIIPEGGNP